ncbi:MFS transporter [Pseudosporangium ferrugineum]|uniref:Putative MFS family arabinose efflux permease n=1 Tax=Pseudosporangium ferrugineum TaxID=439699 RepID=A0A2T0S7T2_9ACTN|nr:MFS transporter [Pseudosporangium ferrugineum]PRY29491.1 putative MFS family arabinose efflux permease [Pseudosporangium ferrugineum]
MRAVLSTTFRSLQVRNYRFFATGQLIKLIGVWMMFTAQDWLVLDLSGNSPGALGVVTALQFLPVLLLTLWGGKLADRHDKRKLLIVANAVFAITAIVFAVLVASGIVVLWHVFMFALLLGVANAVETPVRQAFVSELVELPLLPNALALSAAAFNSARIGGPALAGIALALFDTGPVFLIATALSIAPIFSYRWMRAGELYRSEERAKSGETKIVDGLRYVRKRHDLLLPIGLMAAIGMIGFNFPVTLAALAKINFHAGPSSFGLLTTALAVGALGGALAGSARRSRPGAYLVLGAALAFSVFEIAVGFAPTFLVAMILLVPTGFFSIYLAQAANHRVQMGVDAGYRGRVMALYVLVFLGTTPVGASLAGWWGEHFGVPSSIWAAGIVCLVASVVALLWQLRTSGDRLSVRVGPRPRLTLVRTGAEDDTLVDESGPARMPARKVAA